MRLENLSKPERDAVAKILKEYAAEGKSSSFDFLLEQDFDEVPVDIHTFLHDRRYLGNALYNADGEFTLWPYWEEVLSKVFPTNTTTAINCLILTGAIGIGKSFVAVLCMLYLLYRLLCLRDPYLYYGMTPTDKITISLMNITIENAKGVAMDKMNQLIMASPWFLAHGDVAGETNLVYRPSKHIEIVVASSNNQVIGRALFCLDGQTKIETSEGTFTLEELKDKQIKVISIDENGNKVLSDFCTVKPTIQTNEEYQIELEDGTVIKCTGNHRLRLKDGTYKEARLLTESDELMDVQVSYNDFIGNIIRERGQWSEEIRLNCCERHHIVPKCLGGLPKTLNWSHDTNVIWLTAKEHFIAHKLLAYENPDNYDLVCAFKRMCYSVHNDFEVTTDNIEFIKKTWAKLHSQALTGTKHVSHTIKDKKGYSAQKSRQCSGIGNLMYWQGYKISNGNNGHATTRYFINNLTFESGKELIEYLRETDKKISSSTIRKLKSGSVRVLREHPILKELKWEAKKK